MKELLKELGYSDEQINGIIEAMNNKKIYTSSEENADIRIQKLNDDFTSKDNELTQANELIKQLQEGNKDNESLQTKITEYENTISNYKKEKIDNALKFELLKNKANPDDIDYLVFKLKEKNADKEFEIDENGNIKNFDFAEAKKEYQKFFEDDTTTLVDVKKLGGSEEDQDKNEEPTTMLEALKDKYMKENEI